MPEGIRTPDPRLRRPLLYPAELRTHAPLIIEAGFPGIATYAPAVPHWHLDILSQIPPNVNNIFQKTTAGDGNRTHVSSLEGWCSTIELHPHLSCSVGVTGFEPATSWSQTRRSSQAEPHPANHLRPLADTLHIIHIFPQIVNYFFCHFESFSTGPVKAPDPALHARKILCQTLPIPFRHDHSRYLAPLPHSKSDAGSFPKNIQTYIRFNSISHTLGAVTARQPAALFPQHIAFQKPGRQFSRNTIHRMFKPMTQIIYWGLSPSGNRQHFHLSTLSFKSPIW